MSIHQVLADRRIIIPRPGVVVEVAADRTKVTYHVSTAGRDRIAAWHSETFKPCVEAVFCDCSPACIGMTWPA